MELYLSSIVVPVVGLTIVAFLMICDVLSGLFRNNWVVVSLYEHKLPLECSF